MSARLFTVYYCVGRGQGLRKNSSPLLLPSDLSHNANWGAISRLNNSIPLIFAGLQIKKAVSSGGLLGLRSLSSYC